MSQFFGDGLGQNQRWVIMSGREPHYHLYSYDLITIQYLMIFCEIIEYKVGGDTNTHLLFRSAVIFKIKKGDI